MQDDTQLTVGLNSKITGIILHAAVILHGKLKGLNQSGLIKYWKLHELHVKHA